MATRQKRTFWRTCRIYFRRFRIAVWLIILVLVCCVLYLNQIGLPGFIKNPLLAKLRAQGIDLQFTRLRVRWDRGIVAENVRFGRADDSLSPNLAVREVAVGLDYNALRKLRLQVDSLMLRQGTLAWPIAETNRAPRQITLDNIQTELHLLPNDQWRLDDFTAGFASGRIQCSGSVTNASEVRNWKFLRTRGPIEPGAVQNRLQRLADILDQTHFAAPPDLKLDIRGDARDPQSFNIRLVLIAPGSQTPWGNFGQGQLTARLFPATNGGSARAQMDLHAVAAQTAWGNTTNLHLILHLATDARFADLVDADLILTTGKVETRWGFASDADFDAHWMHSFTNPIPLSGRGHIRCVRAETKWGKVNDLELTGSLMIPDSTGSAIHTNWGPWAQIEPFALDCAGRVGAIDSPKLQATDLTFAAQWKAPELSVSHLAATLYKGKVEANGKVDVATRRVQASFSSDIDPLEASHLLTEGGRHWLEQFTWPKAPSVHALGAVILPSWTNHEPNWRAEVLPTLFLEGDFKAPNGGAFRGISMMAAQSHFTYSNMTWTLPDLSLSTGGGQIHALHQANDRSKDYYWRITSNIDPSILRPLLQTNQLRAVDLIAFTQAPFIDGEIWGRWDDHDRTGFKARVALTNFTFRGESADSCGGLLEYTNRLLRVTDAHLERGAERITAEGLLADFNALKLYLTNGFSTADPAAVVHAIGPKVSRIMEPYRFTQPPTARVYGVIPLKNPKDADLFFDISGGPFHWLKFSPLQISGKLHWQGERLFLNDIRANLYGGAANGSASFDFRKEKGTDFQFFFSVTNAQLHALIADVAGRSNKLEGLLGGTLVVNQANSLDLQTWQGGGNVDLHDGLIWDIPIFGIFSPVLNGIVPGLGNSRASAATGTFSITNGVVHSEDVEIRSPALRLNYRGIVDLRGQVDARVEAELLRDTWMIGPLISTVFWPVTKLFEYKVTGSLSQPKTEPLFFVPKIVLMPFHPLRTLKDLLPDDGPPFAPAPAQPKSP
jgi:hypothetical protein